MFLEEKYESVEKNDKKNIFYHELPPSTRNLPVCIFMVFLWEQDVPILIIAILVYQLNTRLSYIHRSVVFKK